MTEVYKRTIYLVLTVLGLLCVFLWLTRRLTVDLGILPDLFPGLSWSYKFFKDVSTGYLVIVGLSLTAQAGIISLRTHHDNKNLKALTYTIDRIHKEIEYAEKKYENTKDPEVKERIQTRLNKLIEQETTYMNLLIQVVHDNFGIENKKD